MGPRKGVSASALCDELQTCSTAIIRNDIPHLEEHAIEVQLPFVYHLFPKANIVPILIGRTTRANTRTLTGALATVFHDRYDGTLFVVSSNLCSNCDNGSALEEADRLEHAICERQADTIVDECREGGITACGSGGIASILSLWSDDLTVLTHDRTSSPRDESEIEGGTATYYGSFSLHR